jgi:hypothetical protein
MQLTPWPPKAESWNFASITFHVLFADGLRAKTTEQQQVYTSTPPGRWFFLGRWLITDIVNPRGVWNQTTKPLMQFSRMSERRDYDHGLVPTLVNSKTLSPAVSSDMS